jgi:hypothetical protein
LSVGMATIAIPLWQDGMYEETIHGESMAVDTGSVRPSRIA